jgi:hypothetical protein
MTQRSGL